MEINYKVDYPNRTIYAVGVTYWGLEFLGKAKCSPNDLFDAKKGKSIAKLRAKKKQLEYISKKADKELAIAFQAVDKKMNQINKLQNQINEIDNELEEIDQ